jgi:hypothetical protein
MQGSIVSVQIKPLKTSSDLDPRKGEEALLESEHRATFPNAWTPAETI